MEGAEGRESLLPSHETLADHIHLPKSRVSCLSDEDS